MIAIKKAVSNALKEMYPNAKVYGTDTIEGYKKPCFFVYASQTFLESTKNAVHKNVEIEIDYIQKKPNETESMNFFQNVQNKFMQKIQVGERFLNTSEQSSDFNGENNDIPVFTFNIEYWEDIKKPEINVDLIGKIELNTKMKGDK